MKKTINFLADLLALLYLLICGLLRQLWKWILRKWLEQRLEMKVRQAIRRSKLEDRRYIVTTFWGKPEIYSKKSLKEAIKRRQFKKGVTIADIEKNAYFVTK